MSDNVFAQDADDILRLLNYYNPIFSLRQLQEWKSTFLINAYILKTLNIIDNRDLYLKKIHLRTEKKSQLRFRNVLACLRFIILGLWPTVAWTREIIAPWECLHESG